MYFLATKYDLSKKNPHVFVEVEAFNKNLSNYKFVTLLGRFKEVQDLNN